MNTFSAKKIFRFIFIWVNTSLFGVVMMRIAMSNIPPTNHYEVLLGQYGPLVMAPLIGLSATLFVMRLEKQETEKADQ